MTSEYSQQSAALPVFLQDLHEQGLLEVKYGVPVGFCSDARMPHMLTIYRW
jgi:hypothetical protein